MATKKKYNIGIISLGRTGKGIVNSIYTLNYIKSIHVWNRTKSVEEDIKSTCEELYQKNKVITGGGLEEIVQQSDIVILTTGNQIYPSQGKQVKKMRDGSVDEIVKFIKYELAPVYAKNKGNIPLTLVVSNPTDQLSYVLWRSSGISHKKIAGFNYIDTLRCKYFLFSRYKERHPDTVVAQIETYTVGPHGGGVIPVYSHTRINGQKGLFRKSMKSLYCSKKRARKTVGSKGVMDAKRLNGPPLGYIGTAIRHVLTAIQNGNDYVSMSTYLNLNIEEGDNGLFIGYPVNFRNLEVNSLIDYPKSFLDEYEHKLFAREYYKLRRYLKKKNML